MNCSKCNSQNQEEAKFCATCGAALAQAITTTQFVYAGSGRRAIAAIIDFLVFELVFSIFYGLSLVLPLVKYDRIGPFSNILFLGYLFFSQAIWGQTLGKKLMKIKVVNAQGNKPSAWVFFLREVIGKIVSSVVLFIGFLMILWDKRKQGLHDKIAGTFVVPELSQGPPVTNTESSQKDQKKLTLSLLITSFLAVGFIFISVKLWGYFYSLGLSDTAPHGENLGQGGIVFIPVVILIFIYSKFLAAKLVEDTRTAVKIIIASISILIIALGALILFTPKDVPQTLFNRGRYGQLLNDYPEFAKKPEVYSAIKSYYMSRDIEVHSGVLFGSWIIDTLEQLLELNPEDVEVKNRLVLMNNQLDEAIDVLKKAVQYDPKQPIAYAYLGVAYEKKGETEEAIKQYQTALQLDPNNQTAKEGLERLQGK